MITKYNNISVFCSSSNAASEEFKNVADELGKKIASRQSRLIFGGSGMGLMRIIADAVLDNEGEVLGVMPEFMKEVEWNYNRLTEEQFIWTDSMATRKSILINKADAIIALPGAVGTLEEVSEALSLKRLGRLEVPIVLINTNNFYSPLAEWLEHCVAEKLMQEQCPKMWYLATDVEDAFRYLDSEK